MYVNSITIVGDISSIGSKAFSNSPSIKFILIKGSITFKSESFQDIPGLVSLTIGSTSQIPSYSFTHCDYLETFEILNNIRSVSLTNNAFSNHNIKKIIINSSISFQSSPFDNCNLLNYLFIGGSVSGNYENALNAIDKLENITIAGRIDLISSNTFNSQSTLKEVRLFNAYAIKENSFKDYTNLKYVEIKSSSSSLSIGNSTFSGCTSLVDIKLPDSIQSIGSYLLSGCSSLSVINLPNRLTSISSFMLSNCVLIESLIIPESVRSIGNNAFSNCAKLSQITFQSKTIELNGFCFNNCPLIIDFTFSGTKITLNSYCFSGAECIVNVKIECDTINFNDNCFTNSNVQHVLVNGSVYLGNQIYSEHMQTILIDGNINKIMNTSFSNSASLRSFTSTKTISYQSYNGQYISFSGCINLSSVSFSATMTELIPMFCFANCVKLSSFVIPQSVRQIKEYAFSGCNSLTSIDIPGQIGILGNNIFESCSSLTEVTFQQNRNIGTIPDGCFKSCTSLTTISIPSNIKNIGSRSFYNCNQLSSIQGLTSFSKIGEYAFYKCSFSTLDINGNSLNINQRAFDSCGELANITITGSINSISEYSFSNCPKLVFVNFSCTVTQFPSNVFYHSPNIEQVYFYRLTTLGENSFHSNSKLQLIEIQEQLQEIQQNSFYQCSNLASVSFPNTLTIIGSFAFYRCSKLIYLSFSSLTSIGESAFESCAELLYVQLYGSYPTIPVKAFKSCSKLNGVGFDNAGTITEIRDEAFYQCTSINISLLPFYSLQRIGRSSFCQCDYLKKLLLSPCVTTIDEFAFYRCNSLYVVRLPPRLITLGKSAFYECRNLESINLSIFMNSVEEYSFANTRIKQVIIYPGIIVKPNAFKNCNELVNIEVYSDCTICPNAFTFQNKINLYLADNAQLLSNSLSNHIESIYYLGKEDNCLDEMVNELHRIYEPKPNVFIYVSRKYKNSTFAQYPVKSISITLPEAIDNYDCSAIILTEKQCHFRFDNFNLFSNFVFFISLIK
ncbi:surface antigen BspA-like [Trichomonas vaginalis G3]|uniref:Surface antigen BspA-like n=1 Tax=Trichomonas vaginalis (strain ATCC PRA-98 / G3) TaxID=412133 RepID=A2ESZ1_TRIV3|nr:regulation of response to stimulus [Trichomonas vaginalis G3]EAY04249.1 surface antigen BspA-like [Trichomonas vaginalis G3]KAI5550010.1 regulation of response to stimulus [Trichomonas vaginalis G3]|eukprot:XP_001316472.1 surface antigen BspA-like [Trichomonas vaginalis G3]